MACRGTLLRFLCKLIFSFPGTDALHEASKAVAQDIGYNWEMLYHDLKFNPPRDHDKRARDVEAVKLHSVQRGLTMEKLAQAALTKWRVFSRVCSVEELIKSLRRIEKFAIAHRIEHKFLKSATAAL